MTLLSLAIYNDRTAGVILSGKRGSLTITDVFSAGSTAELFEKNDRLKKNGITNACLTFSDSFVTYFFNSFKGAKESDINKIIGFKVKDYIAFPPEEAIIGYKEISKDTEGKAEVFSAVIERKIVKGSEELLYSRGISNFTCTTSSFPFLNFVETEAYALVTGFKDSTTIFFVSGGKLIYARKMKPDLKDEFVKTMAFYSNKYKETPVGTLYTVGNVNTDGIELPVKAIDPMQYVKTEKSLSLDKETAELILPAIGAAICI